MLKLLINLFIKNPENVNDPQVRSAYGTLCSIFGIFLNIILFAGKFFAGLISGSVAITADAFNNLSDAGSSIITLLGFSLASKKPDLDHPFGYGRIEYLTGLVLSALIMVMGYELGRSSVEKIINPQPIEVSLLPAAILVFSILIKFYMSRYNKRIGKKINSSAMVATATDSLSDTISTTVVLISMGISYLFKINIDAYAGLAVAIFICFAGFNAMKETLSPLLGQAPSKEFVDDIENIVMAHPQIKGIHDLIVHDYGPGRLFLSLHAEVDGKEDIFALHDEIDNIEVELRKKLGALSVIHMDPIDIWNPELSEKKEIILKLIKEMLDSRITIHDFRMVPGTSHTNCIFDAVLPSNLEISDLDAKKKIQKLVHDNIPNHYAVVSIDRSYV